MSVKVYDRKTKTFYIRKPKLMHIGPIKNKNVNIELTQEDKYRITNFVDQVEEFGIEFGAKSILSFSNYDIFKIRDEIKSDKNNINIYNILKEKNKKKSNIEKIKEQLGL